MPLPNALRLYLNEHLSPRLAAQLRRYGFDVTDSQESRMLSRDEGEQLTLEVSEQRAIVTFNVSDFVGLHDQYIEAGREHWGIILSTEESIGVLLHRLLRLVYVVSPDELKNQIRWLNDFK